MAQACVRTYVRTCDPLDCLTQSSSVFLALAQMVVVWCPPWSSKCGSDDPLRDAPSLGKGLAEGNGEATAPAGEQDAQQTLALAGKAEKKEEAEKPHDEGNAPMQQAEAIAPNAVGQFNQVVQFFDTDKMVWLAVDEDLGQMIKDRLMTSDTLGGIWYKRRDGKDKYWIDLKEFQQTNCNKTHGGRNCCLAWCKGSLCGAIRMM